MEWTPAGADPALWQRRVGRLAVVGGAYPVSARRRSAATRDGAGDRRRTHRGGLVLRYRVEETDDRLSAEEGTFTICSFWLVSALVEIGRSTGPSTCVSGCCRSPARYISTPRRSTADRPTPGQLPAAFTHLALINAVVHIIRAEEDADGSGVPARQRAHVAPLRALALACRRSHKKQGKIDDLADKSSTRRPIDPDIRMGRGAGGKPGGPTLV